MPKVKGTYETIFIADLSLGEEGVAALVEKFKALIEKNGTIAKVDEWGKRRFAYPINDMNEGYYVVITFKSAPDFPAELDRLFNIDETIMRSTILKLDHKALEKAAKAKAAAEAAAVAAEEAAAPAAEEATAE